MSSKICATSSKSVQILLRLPEVKLLKIFSVGQIYSASEVLKACDHRCRCSSSSRCHNKTKVLNITCSCCINLHFFNYEENPEILKIPPQGQKSPSTLYGVIHLVWQRILVSGGDSHPDRFTLGSQPESMYSAEHSLTKLAEPLSGRKLSCKPEVNKDSPVPS